MLVKLTDSLNWKHPYWKQTRNSHSSLLNCWKRWNWESEDRFRAPSGWPCLETRAVQARQPSWMGEWGKPCPSLNLHRKSGCVVLEPFPVYPPPPIRPLVNKPHGQSLWQIYFVILRMMNPRLVAFSFSYSPLFFLLPLWQSGVPSGHSGDPAGFLSYSCAITFNLCAFRTLYLRPQAFEQWAPIQ